MFSDEDNQQEDEAQGVADADPQRGARQMTPEHSLPKEEAQVPSQREPSNESQHRGSLQLENEDDDESDEGSSAKVIINLSFDDSEDNEASKDGNLLKTLS